MTTENQLTDAANISAPQVVPQRASDVDSWHEFDSETSKWGWLEASPGKLAAGGLFGVVFGFLLQKGGVAKFDILIGALLLENFVVMKVMLAAIIVGMVGVYFLLRLGLLETQISETNYGGNLLGGLTFGIGFGLLAYCPGTDAAAVGQGNLDALVGMLGLIAGSYLYALSSRFGVEKVSRWGGRGKITLPELLHVPRGAFIAVFAPVLIGILALLEFYGF